MKSIKAPARVISSSEDAGSPEHAVQMYRILPNAELAILPGKHGQYLSATDFSEGSTWNQSYSVDIIRNFLDKQ